MNHPLGIFSWYGFALPFEQRIALIKEAGFAAVSVWWEDEEAPFQLKKENMPSIVRDNGLILDNIHLPFNNSNALWSEDEAVRTAAVQRHVAWLQDCAQFGIPKMVMHLCEGLTQPAPNRYGAKSIEELVQVAEDLHIIIAIENTRRNDNVPYVLRAVKSDNLGFCFDSSHYWLTNKDAYQIFKDYGARLAVTHISDNDGVKDRHWLPGHGVINWAELCGAFPKVYEGCLMLEVSPTADECKGSPATFLKQAYQKISNIQRIIQNSD